MDSIDPVLLERIITVSLVVILPLLPAIAIYKLLPHSESDAAGPFQGLKIKLSGAFGGYFITALLVVVVFKIINPSSLEEATRAASQLNQKLRESDEKIKSSERSLQDLNNRLEEVTAGYKNAQDELSAFNVWKVSGTVGGPTGIEHKMTVSVYPPPSVNFDGTISAFVVELKGRLKPDFPSLKLEMLGYVPRMIHLEKASDDTRILDITQDEKTHTIIIHNKVALVPDPDFVDLQKTQVSQHVPKTETVPESLSHP
jgi:hypothetical protein